MTPPIHRQSVLIGLMVLSIAGCRRPVGRTASERSDGGRLFATYCAPCHGARGDGAGPAAYLTFPRPRNFTLGEFKLRSTPQGMLPTDDDLYRTITRGIPGTAMFAFGDLLTESQRRALVSYVKQLTPQFATAPPIRPSDLLRIPAPPPDRPELVAVGRETYKKLGCDRCHGENGRGDGPAAPNLTDSQGDPFPAADFTRGIFKSGGRPEDLYRTFLTGMAGTPMPSFQAALTDEREAWGLVYYILSLSPSASRPAAGDPGPLEAAEVSSAALSENPEADGWKGIKPHRVLLRPLWARAKYPQFLDVRVARVGTRIAFLLEWPDPTHDVLVQKTEGFADAVAVQFALGRQAPFIGMGDRDKGGAVEIWQWRADRQFACDRGRPGTRENVYPNMAPAFPGRELFAARKAGNPLAIEAMEMRPVEDLNAAGFGTLTMRPPGEQRASGGAVWTGGVYRVLLAGPIRPAHPARDADFTRKSLPVAFAVWDGSAGDRNGTKLVSQWIVLETRGAPAQRVARAHESAEEFAR
jgi:mono/diheme cytochrome c family protein